MSWQGAPLRSTEYTNIRQLPTTNHFAAWAGAAPENRPSGADTHRVRFATRRSEMACKLQHVAHKIQQEKALCVVYCDLFRYILIVSQVVLVIKTVPL